MVVMRYFYVCLACCSAVQGMQEPLAVPLLKRSSSAPSLTTLNACIMRSGSHDTILIDVHNPRPDSPLDNALDALVPQAHRKQKRAALCKKYTPSCGKIMTFLSGIGLTLALLYVADLLKSGADELTEKLHNVEDDVDLVKRTLQVCENAVSSCIPCLLEKIEKSL